MHGADGLEAPAVTGLALRSVAIAMPSNQGGSRDPSPAGYASPYRKAGGLWEGLPVMIQLTFAGSTVFCGLKAFGMTTAAVAAALPFDMAAAWAGTAAPSSACRSSSTRTTRRCATK